MKPTARRKRLVEKGGVEIQCVVYTEGRVWSSVETSTPDGPGPVPLHEAVGALEVAKAILIGQREEA
jgi:hypothetical protein